MRTRLERLERLVCAEHCRFYKPWRETEERCGAFRWLFGAGGNDLLDTLERLRGKQGPSAGDQSLLLRTVCARCAYSPASCGFCAPQRRPTAVPCGGLIVISELLQRGELSLEDLCQPWPHQQEATTSRSVGMG